MKQITAEALKNASMAQLSKICAEIRREIVSVIAVRGGHLASNLGTVELSVALHRVFDFPRDKIVFDVGHQCYAHKLLSDRAERFSTLRTRGGISGFPKRGESEYDCYDTGHAGTALSAALGIAKARNIKGEDFSVIALVGDGSFQNGLIYEALNSIKLLGANVLILLNDNGMSISPTLGGTHDILTQLKNSSRDDIALVERYGLKYAGSVAGNDLNELLPALERSKSLIKTQSVLLHVITKKGQGQPFSENAPMETHGVSPNASRDREYSAALGHELINMAEEDGRVVAVTAAMTDSLGLRGFFERFPDRAFDVGICEEHASVLCAAMATQGMKPYYAIYSTFLQRAFDEIIHDVCGQNLPVTFCIDRAGISGEDGETHQGIFDLSYLSLIPELTVALPKDIGEFRSMLRMSLHYPKPLAIRYPRSGTEGAINPVEIGTFEVLHSTMSDIIVLAAGERCIQMAQDALRRAQAEGMEFTLVNARFLKPLDEKLLRSRREKFVITVEDNVLTGGLGDAVARFYRNRGKIIKAIGYPEAFIPHGNALSLAEEYGVSAEEIYRAVKDFYARG